MLLSNSVDYLFGFGVKLTIWWGLFIYLMINFEGVPPVIKNDLLVNPPTPPNLITIWPWPILRGESDPLPHDKKLPPTSLITLYTNGPLHIGSKKNHAGQLFMIICCHKMSVAIKQTTKITEKLQTVSVLPELSMWRFPKWCPVPTPELPWSLKPQFVC